jgi:undecaprenyl-diphosphatase
MSLLEGVALGLVQGLTEFLPVSSSGHLAVIQELWHMPEQARLGLTAVLHLGTAAALLVFFQRQLRSLAVGLWAREGRVRRESRVMVGKIALASIPAAAAGLLLKPLLDRAFSTPWWIGLFLLLTAGFLFATRFVPERDRRAGWVEALVIGLAQAVALLPGVSRSGATVSAAVFLGMSRRDAFEFSFILSVPVVLAAAVKELSGFDFRLVSVVPVAAGVLVAFGTGLAALWLLRWMMQRRRLHWFALYCLVVGLAVLVLLR